MKCPKGRAGNRLFCGNIGILCRLHLRQSGPFRSLLHFKANDIRLQNVHSVFFHVASQTKKPLLRKDTEIFLVGQCTETLPKDVLPVESNILKQEWMNALYTVCVPQCLKEL